jgi:hypothetical protein
MKEYLKRVFDAQLSDYLDAFGAVLIEGPKWCGKTTTAMQQAKSVLRMQDPDTAEAYLATAQTKPSFLLMGATPRLIDEWQVAPVLWDAVRTAVDDRGRPGQFILTGSNAVGRDQIKHTGTGRIARLRMQPMSLYESRESNGKISLKALFEDPDLDIDGIQSDLSVEQLIFAACRGGWPASLSGKTERAQLMVAHDYFLSVCEDDIRSVDRGRRNGGLARAILRSYARNLSTLASKKSIVADVNATAERLSMPTFDDYMLALQKLFILQDVEAWSPAIRSKTVIRSGLKRGMVDPSIAVAALGLSPSVLMLDMRTFGFIFECLCARDLRAYSQPMNSYVNYYHDRYDLEADFVLHLENGHYALIECKLGSREIEEGAAHLLKLKELIRARNGAEMQNLLREPDLLMVLTGGQIAYTRPDGVKVIPIGCLKD